MTEPKVLALCPKGSDACLQWRVWWPAKFMQEHGYTYDWLLFDKNYKTAIEPAIVSGKYNVVVTPRFSFQEKWMLQRFEYLVHKHNLTWLYEMDDDLLHQDFIERQVTYKMAAYRLGGYLVETEPEDIYEVRVRWEAEYTHNERKRLLKLVDGVLVSTHRLAEAVREHTPASVTVVPNFMDVPWFRDQVHRHERQVPPLTIGWSGGWRFEDDLEVMAQAWARLAKRFPDVRFVVHGGWAVPTIIQRIPVRQLRLLPWSQINDYPAALKNIDIMCCSVSNDPWNLNKTSIKFYEASIAGAVCVGSHALYDQAITHDETGLLATSVDEWETQLVRLVEDANLRMTLQRNAVSLIENSLSLEERWSSWLQAYSTYLKVPV